MPFGYDANAEDKKDRGTKAIPSVKKVYVDVQCLFTTESQIIPQVIYLKNGKSYEIDKIIEARPAASTKVGGVGTQYRVRIMNKETLIYYDSFEKKWFIEWKER